MGFEIKGKFVFEKGFLDVLEANEYGDFECDCSKDFIGQTEKFLESIKASVKLYVDSV